MTDTAPTSAAQHIALFIQPWIRSIVARIALIAASVAFVALMCGGGMGLVASAQHTALTVTQRTAKCEGWCDAFGYDGSVYRGVIHEPYSKDLCFCVVPVDPETATTGEPRLTTEEESL